MQLLKLNAKEKSYQTQKIASTHFVHGDMARVIFLYLHKFDLLVNCLGRDKNVVAISILTIKMGKNFRNAIGYI